MRVFALFATLLCLFGTAIAQTTTDDTAIKFVKSVYTAGVAEFPPDPLKANIEELLKKLEPKPWLISGLTVVHKDGSKQEEPPSEQAKRALIFLNSLATIAQLKNAGMTFEGGKGLFAKLEVAKPEAVPELLRPFHVTAVKWTINLTDEAKKVFPSVSQIDLTIYLMDYAKRLSNAAPTTTPDWRIYLLEKKVT